ncbi:MAG TPA: hypothetical protein VF276_14435 [Chloroflexia bacterium]
MVNEGRRGDWALRLGVALAGAVLLLATLWLPGRSVPHAAAAPAALESVISGTVAWKDSAEPVSGVQVVLKDAVQGTVVGQTTTDAEGVYTITAGVGNWLVDVPSTARYWGYAQTVTSFPHTDYHLDFGITVRPPEAPPAAPPAAATPGATPGTTPAAGAKPGTMPPAGHPTSLGLWLVLGTLLALLGGALRGAGQRRYRAAKETC